MSDRDPKGSLLSFRSNGAKEGADAVDAGNDRLMGMVQPSDRKGPGGKLKPLNMCVLAGICQTRGRC